MLVRSLSIRLTDLCVEIFVGYLWNSSGCLPTVSIIGKPLATQAKRRSRVEDQMKWLPACASDASDSALPFLKFAYSSGNSGVV